MSSWNVWKNFRERQKKAKKSWDHMQDAHRKFSLSEPDQQGNRVICWNKQEVGVAKSVKQLQKHYSGSVFIIASGPSLQEIDLSLLENQTLFGVAGAIVKFREANLKPHHHLMTDAHFFAERFELVEEILETAQHIHLSFHGMSAICERNPAILRDKSIFLHELINNHYQQPALLREEIEKKLRQDIEILLPENFFDERVGFSKNPLKGVFSGRTVTWQAVQLSYYLGFQRVYMLGVDLNATQQVRFYEDAKNAVISKLNKDYEPIILPSFQLLNILSQQENFQVYNLSLQSRLPDDVVPKKSFADVLEMSR